MRIANLTGNRIRCLIDEESFSLDHQQSIDIDFLETAKFYHGQASYSIKECSTSKMLKLLSFLDDPFQLRKEYHLMVDVEITKDQVGDSKQITITENTCYVDIETRTYYEYFEIKCDENQITPHSVHISDIDKISADFERNSRKLVRWDTAWNVLVEPLLLELFGYFMIFKLLYLWIGTAAWCAILPLIILNVLVEIVLLVFKTKAKRENKFYHYLEETVIQKKCWG